MEAGTGDVDGSSSLMVVLFSFMEVVVMIAVSVVRAAESGWSRVQGVDDDSDSDRGRDDDGFMDDECRVGVG